MTRWSAARLVFVLVGMGFLPSGLLSGWRAALAATITVNSTADSDSAGESPCTLREAINIANANNSGSYTECTVNGTLGDDTIVFSVSGIISLSSLSGTLPTIQAAGTLTIDGTGKSITISGEGSVRVLEVATGADLTLRRLTIANGKAQDDGGVCSSANCGGGAVNKGTLSVIDCSFSDNSADLGGGGIYNVGTLTVTNSTFSENSASGGGGIFNSTNATLTVTNSTFSENSASDGDGGGGIFNFGTLTVTNSTFSENSATFGGGGIFNDGGLNYTNTIIANSTAGGDCVNSSGTISTNTNNLVEDGSCSASLSGDPKLAPLANNGGPTQTHALLPGSPAIDAGTSSGCPITDQRGVMRPQDGDGNGSAICDIGAYEVAGQQPVPLLSGWAVRVLLVLLSLTAWFGLQQRTAWPRGTRR